jgi:D-lactate dehydrogenase
LNRNIYRAYTRVRQQNFLLEGLLGFDLHGCTVGIIGTGNIGSAFAKIMHGFGCQLLAVDPIPNPACKHLNVHYVTSAELYGKADIISLHCPLTENTYHLINEQALSQMRPGVMLINTGRGALIDTQAVISALKSHQIGYLGIDVYEQEEALFSKNLADTIIQDDLFVRLQAFPNVVITAHQGFLTHEALSNIAQTTLDDLTTFEQGNPAPHRIS